MCTIASTEILVRIGIEKGKELRVEEKPCFNHQTCCNSLVRSSYPTLPPTRLEGFIYMIGYIFSFYQLKLKN